MTRSEISFAVFLSVLFFCALLVTGFALKICSMGAITVSVKEHGSGGDDISISLPASVASAAIFFAPDKVFRHAEHNFQGQLPVVRAACRAIARAPDCVLVEVSGRDENVRIRKIGGELVVEAETNDESVNVRVPVKLVQDVLARLARSSESA
ncbi:MAG: hypothetical protein ACKVU1_04660 [bacterium]